VQQAHVASIRAPACLPRYGDVITLDGITAAGTMNATGCVVTGCVVTGYYDPSWG
jgi:hypothetical protein